MAASQQQQEQQQRAVPDYVDAAATSIPDSTWAIVPRSSSSLDEGWHHFTFADLARAVDSLARWIERTCGVAEHQGQTMGYMG